MAESRTVAVHHPKDPTRPTLIRRENYDPREHKLWAEPEKPVPAVPAREAATPPRSAPHHPDLSNPARISSESERRIVDAFERSERTEGQG